MIQRRYKNLTVECDECGEELETDTEDFREFLDTIKGQNWTYRRDDEIWRHYCPDCSVH